MPYRWVVLNVVPFSPPHVGRPRLVLVHGFTQNHAVWLPLAGQLADDFEVVGVDLPGHGQSDALYDSAGLVESARLLVETCGQAIYIGYSLGARVVLHAALDHQDKMAAAVLIGAKAGFTQAAERHARRVADNVLADRIDDLGDRGLAEFIDDWLAQPFNAVLSPGAQFREARLANRAHGLAESLRHCGAGSQEPVWDRLGSLRRPMLLLQGSRDLPTVMSDNEAMHRALGRHAELITVDEAGHAGPFEAPERFGSLIKAFVAATT